MLIKLIFCIKKATSGLLWKEEADLEKALRASIQDNRSKELTETTSSTSDIQSALYQRNIDGILKIYLCSKLYNSCQWCSFIIVEYDLLRIKSSSSSA